MRNPFCRQIETAAPTLSERAASLREGLNRQAAPTPAPAERADLYDRLLVAYAEDRAARPISGSDGDETARRAANLVLNRTWALARDVVSMPPPATLDGLRATALASAMLCEAESTTEDPTTVSAIGLTRAVLAVTGTPLPPGFCGFGDEPDHITQDREMHRQPGSLPAWAIAEIKAENASFPPAPTDLADACLWAVRHRAWIDGELKASEWSDEKFDGESAKTNATFTRAINEPSANLREITAKAALALEDFERFHLLPGRKLDDGTRIVHTVLREIVGVGREASASVALMSSSDLPAAILDGWAAWGATTGFGADASAEELAPWERASEHRDRLLYAAMALPATPESIAAKALACAWMEWVNVEQPGKPRDAYGPADQLVYDINATIMARGTQGDVTTTRRPIELPLSLLVPTVDFAGASMRELRAIREAADLVCSVASAATWQGCNHLPDDPNGGARFNRAGELMRWVSDALCHVVTASQDEARRRLPENNDARGERLAMLAGITIDNEDPAEIAAFARELLAMVEP